MLSTGQLSVVIVRMHQGELAVKPGVFMTEYPHPEPPYYLMPAQSSVSHGPAGPPGPCRSKGTPPEAWDCLG